MKSNEEGYRAIVVPQTVEAGVSIFAITVNGVAYRFKYQQGTAPFAFESGKQAKFTISINKKVPSGDYEFALTNCDIVDWVADIDTHGGEARQYYVVHQEEPGTLSTKLREAKKNPAKIKNLKISGKIDAADFYFMRDSMTVLQSINLKESKVCTFTKASAFNNGIVKTASWENDYDAATKSSYGNYVASRDGKYYYTGQENRIPSAALQNKATLTNFVFPQYITGIGSNAFFDCINLSGALIIPDDVTTIAGFRGCSSITSVVSPVKLKRISGSAFSGCSSISGTINFPNSLTYIGSNAFWGCSGISGELELPSNLTYLGASAFYGCSGISGSLTIPKSINVLYGGTFSGCSGLNGPLTLHDNLTLSREIAPDGAAGYDTTDHFYNCRFTGELKLPSNIQSIPNGCFASCQFSSIDKLPEGLLEIGAYAFYGCWRLSGVIEFPNSLVSLGEYAFSDCSALEGIVLPEELGVIKANTFNNCYYINKITCNAIEPPTILSGAFDGVAKDNFTVEVLEQSVNSYQNDTKWGEFKRIGAHYDFSISRKEMRVLNAEHSRKFVLRAPAGLEWSIERKPDWITVSPSSGVGKQNVVIRVNEMTAADVVTFEVAKQKATSTSMEYTTYKGRGGEVVFLLNDKNYRTTIKVEQYDCEYGDGDVITNQTALEGNGVNIVFMGDCFDAQDIATGKYLVGVNEAIGYYFNIEPYKTYKPYFNIYTVVGMSNDSGMGTVNTIRDAKFCSQYSLNGILLNHEITYEYAMKTSTVNKDNLWQTLVVMIENTTEYGGITYMWNDGSAIACCPMSSDAYPYDFRGIVQHEASGHGFGKLADEYIYHNVFIKSCNCNECCNYSKHLDSFLAKKALGWYRNLESVGDMDKVGWSHFIFNPKYSNIVDIYEGGYFHSRGIFRSEPNSCMNNNTELYILGL